jgi:hypothetical protein
VGKPDCFTVDEKGIGHFYGHADISEKKTGVILERLKASNFEKSVVGQLVKFHDREILCKPSAVKRFMQKCNEDVYLRIFDLKRHGKPFRKHTQYGAAVSSTIQPSDYRWLFPIPQSEYRYNDKITQNNPQWPFIKTE